jgi:alkanesulfonate monooxygenase SsuD/methylene tetrahydromethanopterin reductase-like flavin-dependent oxidoreductase (luciferase family)
MGSRKISRRDALGVIGRGGAAGAGTFFFLTLKTAPLAAAPAGVDARPPARPTEKVMIAGSGPNLTVKLAGQQGRHFGVAFSPVDTPDQYRPVPNARGRIAKGGVATIAVNVGDLPEGRVFLRIVTGRTDRFDEDIAGTEAFVIHISKGRIQSFEGLTSRPLENAKSIGVSVASCASAGYAARR